MDFAFTIAGFIVGFIIGLTGVGGGSLMTPILVLFFHIPPALAVGTDLLYAAITKSGGIFVHHSRRTIEWPIVGLLCMGSIPATFIAIAVLKYLGDIGMNYDRLITSSLSVALILTSLVLIFKKQLLALGQNDRFSTIREIHFHYQRHMTVLAGALIGILVTFSSVGAGALGAAILFFLYPRVRSISIVGTDLAHAVPITAIAGLGHLHLGTVDLFLLGSLILGSLPGIYIGSHLGSYLPEKIMRPVLASMLFMIGLRMAI